MKLGQVKGDTWRETQVERAGKGPTLLSLHTTPRPQHCTLHQPTSQPGKQTPRRRSEASLDPEET